MEIRARLAEQVLLGWTNEIGAAAGARVDCHTADDGDGDSIRFAHDEFGSGGELIGDRDDGRLQGSAARVLLSAIIEQGIQTRDAERDIDQAFAPRAPECVGDNHADLASERFTEARLQCARGAKAWSMSRSASRV